MSENRNTIERHGCIVCAKIFNMLVVYSPDGKMVDCAVTSPNGHCLKEEKQPLVACNTHPEEIIKAAHKRWLSRNDKGEDDD